MQQLRRGTRGACYYDVSDAAVDVDALYLFSAPIVRVISLYTILSYEPMILSIVYDIRSPL